MRLTDIQYSFNRAASHILSRPKFLIVFSLLILVGIVSLFFRAAAGESSKIAALGLLFIPFFLSIGLLFSLGIFLSRLYHDEVKGKDISLSSIFLKSWDVMVATSYFSLPLFFAYLILWFALAIFALMQNLPLVGPLVAIFFSFAPFLINLLVLLLLVLALLGLFFLTPLLAFRGLNRERIARSLQGRLQNDLFYNFFLGLIAFLPLFLTFLVLSFAAWLTDQFCLICETPEATFLSWFFILFPFAALLTPSVIFFFNFSIEAHLLMMREENQNSSR